MKHAFIAISLLAVTACQATPGIIYEAPGLFGSIVVEQNAGGMRTLLFERFGARQSVVKLGDPDHLELSYTRTILAGLALSGKSKRMLVLGLGGGTLPMFLRKNYPEAIIDVVEIDPAVVDVAKRYFNVREDQGLRIHRNDARSHVESSAAGLYDLIIVDAFGANSAPPHLTTREFVLFLRHATAPGGVVLSNIWQRPFNANYDSMVLTYQSVFEQTLALNVPGDANSIIIAIPRGDPVNMEILAKMAGSLGKFRRFRIDMESLVRRAFVSVPDLNLKGNILLDRDLDPQPPR